MVTAERGVLIYGGMFWNYIDTDETDLIQAKKNKFWEECRKVVEKNVERAQRYIKDLPTLTIDDIGGVWWQKMFARSGNKCFDTKY